MKKINISFLFLLGVLLFTSCGEKYLDLAPQSEIGANGFYRTTAEVEAGVIAIYDGLQNIPLREFAVTEMRTDNSRTKSSEGEWKQFQVMDIATTNSVVKSYWAANYNVIFRANTVLANLDAVTDADKKSRFEAEAKFARALGHFNLVRAYGDVPLIDAVINQSDTEYFSRDASSAVYAQIDSDLTAAAAALPSAGEADFGRATKGAANGILAKVKLSTGDHAGAATLLEALMNDAEYALMGDYNDVFYTEGNNEILFGIPYLEDGIDAQDFSYEMTAFGAASGLNYLTSDFIAAMDPSDTRKATIQNSLLPGETAKYITFSSDTRLCGNDWIVLRLSDVYLMLAEAKMAGAASTQSISAINAYNAIRNRAGLSELATDGTETLTKQMLSDERRIELAFENHRLYDLVRMGLAESTLSAFAADEGFSFTATDLLLPIPQGEINISGGALTQNPGYQ